MILAGALYAASLNLGVNVPAMGFVGAMMGIRFVTVYLDIVTFTIVGGHEFPDWPSPGNFWDDTIEPFFRMAVLFFISCAPVNVVFMTVWCTGSIEAWYALPACLAAAALGAVYFPMAVLATQVFGRISAALPHVVFPAILMAMPFYLLVPGTFVLILPPLCLFKIHHAEIDFGGWFLASASAIYGLMLQARLLGLIYLEKREKLKWPQL